LPPRCLGCGAQALEPASLCASCWSGLTFVTRPFCRCCGLPFEIEAGQGALCGACLRERPPYGKARAALLYDEASRRLLLPFKHADRTESARLFLGWLSMAGSELLAEADLIAPVPLHWRRLLARRYNQAALLSQGLAQRSGKQAAPDLLVRRKATKSQGRMSRAGRRRNVAGAFAVHPRWRGRLKGRRVLLLDDVMMTGATVEACARVLKRAGAAEVHVLLLARVVR
jgi:ComF family protein